MTYATGVMKYRQRDYSIQLKAGHSKVKEWKVLSASPQQKREGYFNLAKVISVAAE